MNKLSAEKMSDATPKPPKLPIPVAMELEFSTSADDGKSFLERRQMLPGYETARKAGACRPAKDARDVTKLISEDRDAR